MKNKSRGSKPLKEKKLGKAIKHFGTVPQNCNSSAVNKREAGYIYDLKYSHSSLSNEFRILSDIIWNRSPTKHRCRVRQKNHKQRKYLLRIRKWLKADGHIFTHANYSWDRGLLSCRFLVKWKEFKALPVELWV